MTNEIQVLGMVMGTHVLEDIGIDVPYGAVVGIPLEKANMSKDLWRAISQKCIARVRTALPPVITGSSVPTPAPTPVKVVLDTVTQEKLQALEEQNRQLALQNESLQRLIKDSEAGQQKKLDAILGALQSGGLRGEASPSRSTQQVAVAQEVVDSEAPRFIPSEICPKDVATHIEGTKQEQSTSSVSQAAEALRKLRGKR